MREESNKRNRRFEAIDVFQHLFANKHHIEARVEQCTQIGYPVAMEEGMVLTAGPRSVLRLACGAMIGTTFNLSAADDEIVDLQSQLRRKS